MTAVIRLVQGDTPTINLVLSDRLSGAPVDISSANVFLNFRKVGTTQVLAAVACTRLTGKLMPDGSISTAAPYNAAGKGGRAAATLSALNFPAGNYEASVSAVFASGLTVTAFDPINFLIRASF